MTIEQRVEQLERRNRHTRLAALVLLAALIGTGLFACSSTIKRANAQSTSMPRAQLLQADIQADIVTAKEFRLMDENGRSRAVLLVDEGRVALMLCDEAGNVRAALRVVKDEPGLSLYDENSTRRAAFGVAKEGPILKFWDEEGEIRAALIAIKDETSLTLRDEAGKPRAVLVMGKDNANLFLCDKNGKVIWSTP